MRPRRSPPKDAPGFTPGAVVLLVFLGSAALLVVPVMLVFALALPGASAAAALDCFADGACTIGAMPRGGPVIVTSHHGAMAYGMGGLQLLLGYVTSHLTVTTVVEQWRGFRGVPANERELDGPTAHAVAFTYLVVDTVVVAGLVAWIDSF